MLVQLVSTLFLATVVMTATVNAPRLELRRVDLQPSSANGHRIIDVELLLINDGTRPVEAWENSGIVPKLTGPDGKPVVLFDFRNLAGYAPPTLPPDPQAPVRKGESRRLELYSVMRGPHGYEFMGPHGGAQLAAGRYRIEAAIDLEPATRSGWIAMHAKAVNRPGGRPKNPQAAAEQAAAKFEAHWNEVPNFFRGHLAAPPLEFVLP